MTKEEIEQPEKGNYCDFYSLPKAVKEIALQHMSVAKSESELVGLLDSCHEIRFELGYGDDGYVKEIDLIMRHWRSEHKGVA